MFYWIYDVPTQSLAVLFALVFVGYSLVGCVLLRPILRMFVKDKLSTNNDVVGYVLSCFCVFYGILLGLLAVAVYQNYTEVDQNVNREATALSALYYDVSAYPEPHRSELRVMLREYCNYVIADAWPLQRKGIVPKGGIDRVVKFQRRLVSFLPRDVSEQIIHAETLRQFNNFVEMRRMRLHSINTGIPAVMWYVVIVGALINTAMVWLFEMKFSAHLLLGGLLSFYLGAMIFLIAVMDNPLRGEVSISSDSYKLVLELMDRAEQLEPIE